MRRIPASFQDAIWYGTLPVCTEEGKLGVSFERFDGHILRLKLPVESARHLAESVLDYLENSHSAKSSGIESVPGSTPLLGKSV
jgi:hypothetical protein